MKVLLGLIAGALFVFLVFPSIMAVPMSFSETRFLSFPPKGFTVDWYRQFLSDEFWTKPTIFSLKVATLTTMLSLFIGTMASLALVRGNLPGKTILNIFFISPIMIPIIIIAFAVYGVYAKLNLIGTDLGMVIGHTILSIPFVILVVSANLYRFDMSLEMAARNLGANAVKTFMYITLPLIRPAIIASAVFSFITSLDDVVLAMFLVGTKRTTLPIMIFSQIKFKIDPVVAAASTVFILSAIFIVIFLGLIKHDKKAKMVLEKKNDYSGE